MTDFFKREKGFRNLFRFGIFIKWIINYNRMRCKELFMSLLLTILIFWWLRNWVIATNLDFLIPISSQLDDVNLWYFKIRLCDPTEFIVWNIKGLQHWVAETKRIKNVSLLQELSSFIQNCILHMFVYFYIYSII